MQRVSTTVLTIVGQEATRLAEALGRAANVRLLTPDPDGPPLVRAADALREAAGTSSPFAVTDADPLAAVLDAWVRFYDEPAVVGELEVAVADTVARWRAGVVELPDYYFVAAPDALPPTRRHWFLGFLHAHAPPRVIPVVERPEAMPAAVGRLRAGRWWPPCDQLLDGLQRMAPDAFTAEVPGDESRRLVAAPKGWPAVGR